jgi:hypothetical protein
MALTPPEDVPGIRSRFAGLDASTSLGPAHGTLVIAIGSPAVLQMREQLRELLPS